MDASYSEEYKEKQATGTLQKKYLERSYKIARSMFDPLPPKNSSLFHPRKHDDKIEIQITTTRINTRNFAQNNQHSRSASRTPNTSYKTNINNFTYDSPKSPSKTSINNYTHTSPRSPSRTPNRYQSQSYIAEPSSESKKKSYYQFLAEYSSSFMN